MSNRPKPTALRLLRGNPSGRPINKSEPRARPGEPELPEYLVPAAVTEWKRIVPLFRELGVLATVDGSLLADYCQIHARLLEAEELITKHGTVIERPVLNRSRDVIGTDFKKNPAVTVAADLLKQKRAILASFGGDPSSRSRIKGATQPLEESPLLKLIKRQQANRDRERNLTPEQRGA